LRSLLGLLWRVYSYLFELGLALFLIGLGIVAWASGPENLQLGMFPWDGAMLTRAILISGMAGLACVLLAGSSLRWIFPLWCLFALVMMIRGFFLSSYSFGGANEFQLAAWLTAGALLAFLGSLGVLRRRAKGRR